jgi:hypothetical protein
MPLTRRTASALVVLQAAELALYGGASTVEPFPLVACAGQARLTDAAVAAERKAPTDPATRPFRQSLLDLGRAPALDPDLAESPVDDALERSTHFRSALEHVEEVLSSQ